MRAKFEVVETVNGEWSPRIRAGNGEIWFTAESSKRKSTAKRRLERFMQAFGVLVTLNPIKVVGQKR